MKKRAFIPDYEYVERLKRAQKLLNQTDLDVLLVSSNEADFANVRYFSNYWPIFEIAGVLIPRQGPPSLLIGPESETFARDRSKIDRIYLLAEYRESADPSYPGLELSAFTDVFKEAGAPNPKRIGIGGSLVTTYPVIQSLRSSFPNAELVPADQIMIALRGIKSEAEIACLREAFHIAELAMDQVLEQIRPGMTELQVVGIVQQAIYAYGAEYEGMPQYVLSGKNTTHAISRPTHKVIKSGELVQLNLSARVDGYSSGVGRPVFMGKIPGKIRDAVQFGLEAHKQVAAWLKSGVIASDIAKRYHNYFVEQGRKDQFLYGPCHGLGMIEVEPPWMESDSDYSLQNNMTFQIDTFVQDVDFGLRWENGARILDSGVDAFSNRRMEIIEIT